MRSVWVALLGIALSGCDTAVQTSQVPSRPPLARTATVGLFADAQYCDCAPEADRHYRASLWKLGAAADAFDRERVDFSVHLGDLIERDAESFAPALGALAGLDSALVHVLGNHDFDVAGDDRESVPERLGMEARYYERSKGLWRFVFMDGTDLSTFATAPGSTRRAETDAMRDSISASGGEVHLWNGGVGREQLAWLRATLDDALARGQRVVILSHFPLYPFTTHNLWNADAVLAVLDDYSNIVAHVSGHDHGGRATTRAGVYHIGIEGVVETRGQNAYAVAYFGVHALELRGVGRAASVVLPYRNGETSARRRRPGTAR